MGGLSQSWASLSISRSRGPFCQRGSTDPDGIRSLLLVPPVSLYGELEVIGHDFCEAAQASMLVHDGNCQVKFRYF